MKAIQPYDVLSAEVFPLNEERGDAELRRLIGVERSDPELVARADEASEPTVLHDDYFGELLLNKALDWYEADAQWMGRPTRLYLSCDERGLPPVLQSAKAVWSDQQGWQDRVRSFASGALLELKNESWLEEGEHELTAQEFESRMTLESVSFYPEGQFEFLYQDGDLFWGHAIQVTGSLEAGPTDADIPG